MRFKRLESEIQSPEFSSAQISPKTRALEKLLGESTVLNQRFAELNIGFLYEKGIAEEVDAHTKKMRKLYDRLSRAGRKRRDVAKATPRPKRRLRWPGSVTGVLEKSPPEPSPTMAAE